MEIMTILKSGDVTRFHASPGIEKQRNSEHQWQVSLIAQYLDPDCSKNLLLACMTHDAAELYTGDIPFTIKRSAPEIKTILDKLELEWEREQGIGFQLTEEEHFIMKAADTLSGMYYCLQQVKQGKSEAREPFRRWSEVGDGFVAKAYQMFDKAVASRYFHILTQLKTEMENL